MLSYNAIPSIFMVAPIGTIKLDILEGIPMRSKHDIVTGTVAVLKYKYKVYNIIILLTSNKLTTYCLSLNTLMMYQML